MRAVPDERASLAAEEGRTAAALSAQLSASAAFLPQLQREPRESEVAGITGLARGESVEVAPGATPPPLLRSAVPELQDVPRESIGA